MLVSLGELSSARQALEGAELAPRNQATLNALQDPTRRPPRAQAALPDRVMTHVPPPGLAHDSPRTPNVHISGPRRFRHHQNSTKGPQEKEERKLWREEGKKSAKFWAPTLRGPTLRGSTFSRFGASPFGPPPFFPPPFWAPPFWAPPFWAPPFWAPPFGAPPFEGPTLCGPKIQHPKIGRSRNWPKSKKKAGRSRNWPKSIALVPGGVQCSRAQLQELWPPACWSCLVPVVQTVRLHHHMRWNGTFASQGWRDVFDCL